MGLKRLHHLAIAHYGQPVAPIVTTAKAYLPERVPTFGDMF
ncbi:precorrin-6Y C(5,15)-methyltransferase [Brucella ceti B1/94]|nr:Hypothetical protein BSSP3_I1308 [Brucella suis bv. 2]AIB20522.1 Hypothetical protein BSPT1_I0416 [Brucella suis bv. 2]AIB27278.1 Hypothetical protein BSSP1_I0409 [Brucella suis bv. 2]EEX87673.1 precorrin-6Y C(5,15)-methyltransferase [Brucella ceti B1/94]